MLRRLVLAALAVLIPSAAAAQDASDWSGFYLGVNLGGGSSRVRAASTDTVTQVSNLLIPGSGLVIVPQTTTSAGGRKSSTDALYGASLGYLAPASDWVLGLEGEVLGGHSSGQVNSSTAIPGTLLSPAGTLTTSRDLHTSYEWSLRAKAGRVYNDTLVYAEVGAAESHLRLRARDVYTLPAGTSPGGVVAPALGTFVTTASDSKSLTGWSVGAGAERQVAAHLRLGVEARYDRYPDKTFSLAGQSTSGPTALNYGTGPSAGTPLSFPPQASPGPTKVRLSDLRVSLRLNWAL